MITTKNLLKERARRRTVGYDAYRDIWDKPIWHVIRVLEDMGTVLGTVFKKGDVTLARYGRDVPGAPPSVTDVLFAFSFRSGGEAAVQKYEVLEDA